MSPTESQKQTVVTGSRGEGTALTYLRSLGYAFRGRNVRLGHDEIDLLMHDPVDDVLVFVEVKSRRAEHSDYDPTLNVTWRKHRSMRRAARIWVDQHGYEGGWRLDVVTVAGGKVRDHIIDYQ